MRVFYVGRDREKEMALLSESEDVLLLGFDKWDDYDYKTTFTVRCRIRQKSVDTGAIKILFEDYQVSYEYLDRLVNEGWNGEFPIPNSLYISVPNSVTFYQQIAGHLDHHEALGVARLLNDASLKVWIENDKKSLELVETAGFKVSLLRERAAQAAYHDSWKIFKDTSIDVGDLRFRFYDPQGQLQTLSLAFNAASLMPHDIHVLIGPNGVGKSQTLMQLVEYWLDLTPAGDEDVGFVDSHNINQVVVVSYSPFELFPVATDNTKKASGERQDADVYKYFGLRGRQRVFDQDGEAAQKIRLSHNRPMQDAAQSLIACLADDQKYGSIKDWSKKVKTMERVLSTAIDFDVATVAVDPSLLDSNFPQGHSLRFESLEKTADALSDDTFFLDDRTALVAISASMIDVLDAEQLQHHMKASKGVIFLKDGKRVELSSGQRLFSYMVINILGAIRRNSLLLIDEPELFLHPTMEIAFITMLKDILESFRSKALIATHSLVTVRELPRDCVHVFEKPDGELVIKHPPFETFGGDIQRISSYVFGDKSISKPFETWIEEKLNEFDSADSLIEALGENINEEMIIQISAMGAGKW